jgi:hypothetical protein
MPEHGSKVAPDLTHIACSHCSERKWCSARDMYFECDTCKRSVPWCMGGGDDMLDSCDDCWVRWMWLWDVPRAIPCGGWGIAISPWWDPAWGEQ